jgi:general secretion pathway protein K
MEDENKPMKSCRAGSFSVRAMIRNRRGVALLLTLSIIALVVTVSMTLHRRSRESLSLAAANRDWISRVQMAASGIHAGMALLIRDKAATTVDSIQEEWADADSLAKLAADLSFEEGNAMIAIGDELGKIQINALVNYPEGRHFNEAQKRMWQGLLFFLKDQNKTLEGFEPETIINSLKDWLDSDDDDAITGVSGAESGYYQTLNPPYSCRNGPMTQLSELSLVRGILPAHLTTLGGIPGLSKYMTVYGATPTNDNSFTYEGKININTADLPVLAALLPIPDQGLARSIYDYRKEAAGSKYAHALLDTKWYRNAPGCGDLRIDPDLITTSSDVFRIESTADLRGAKTTAIAVILREKDEKTGKWTCKVLSWNSI